MSPQARGPLDQLKDLTAAMREHMTDEELLRARLITDQVMYGFCAIDAATGQRIDPREIEWTDHA